jgi:hypothetical protein
MGCLKYVYQSNIRSNEPYLLIIKVLFAFGFINTHPLVVPPLKPDYFPYSTFICLRGGSEFREGAAPPLYDTPLSSQKILRCAR